MRRKRTFKKRWRSPRRFPCVRSKQGPASHTPTCCVIVTVPVIVSSRVCFAARPNPWRQRWAPCCSYNVPETCGTPCKGPCAYASSERQRDVAARYRQHDVLLARMHIRHDAVLAAPGRCHLSQALAGLLVDREQVRGVVAREPGRK